jgi:hypothetical protein
MHRQEVALTITNKKPLVTQELVQTHLQSTNEIAKRGTVNTLYLVYGYFSGLSSNQTFRKETAKYVSIGYRHHVTGESETI